ncbi:hypothetical protein [Prosthecomicrobium pneumaticum]|uniref:Putative coiled-coil protein SlyX n=1 Tax=Prosthecomicrobium pneumaticum TaxID=81895 RepID=A0A7W9L3Y9_9HYPH|nr:hypothetical protein [Prosthecomicrobium pneumaticum]MBB5755048.1 putative coiled-coil protein SlyX [Prosthecomicrobium pneumaticum]
MTSGTAPEEAREGDYEALEAAVMETARGRWFLAEFTRRRRAADTAAVLEALARLESRLAEPRQETALEAMGREIAALAASLEAARTELAALGSARSEAAPAPSPAAARLTVAHDRGAEPDPTRGMSAEARFALFS